MTTSPPTFSNRSMVTAGALMVMLGWATGDARALSPAATEALENPAASLAPEVHSELQAAWRALVESAFRAVFSEVEPTITAEITTDQLDGAPYLEFKATAEGAGEAGGLIVEVFLGAGPQGVDRRYGKWFEPMAIGGEEIRTVDFPADRAAFTTLAADFRQALYWQSGEIYMETRRSADVEPLARAWHSAAEASGLYDFPQSLVRAPVAAAVPETTETRPTEPEQTTSSTAEASSSADDGMSSDRLPAQTTQDARTAPEKTTPPASDETAAGTDQLPVGDTGAVEAADEWTELEQVKVLSDIPKTFKTTTVLEAGERYRLVASGTFSAWGGEPVGIDAVWCDRAGRCAPPQPWQQLRINGTGINELREAAGEEPLAYNPEHVYELEITGEGKPLSLHLWDAIEVGSAGGNTGVIAVRLYAHSKAHAGGGREATEWTWSDLLTGPRPEGGIRLAVATGGRGCDAKEGNLTWSVARICDGQETCELVLDDLLRAASKLAPDCDPDLALAWRCGSHPESFEVELKTGDIRGRRLRLACGRESVAIGSAAP